ncbi:MAG: hypothetical protein GF307_05320 [candidate division Zixibacteria bacterium]|nr:hypothetical protein [candidate division Zixibacteria bacterium]
MEKANTWLSRLLYIVAGIYILAFIATAIMRMGYPFELEWQEGAIVDHCVKALNGYPLYVKPTMAFVPNIFTPLYYYISANVMGLTGTGFLAPRVVSTVSILVSAFFIFASVWRLTGRKTGAFLSAAILIAAFNFTGCWYDLAHVDSLYLFMLSAAVYCMLRKSSSFSAIASVLFALAYFTRQTAIVTIGFAFLYYLFYNRKQLITFVIPGAALFFILSYIFYNSSGGWYYYYAIKLFFGHPGDYSKFLTFWADIFIGGALIPVLIFIYFHIRKKDIPELYYREEAWPLYFITAGMLIESLFTNAHYGATGNAAFPLIAGASIVLGYSFDGLKRLSQDKKPMGFTVAIIAVFLQFAIFFYPPHKKVPAKPDRQAGEEFISLLKGIEGNVYIRDHGYYNRLAGKDTFAHSAAVQNVIISADIEYGGLNPAHTLRNEMIRRLAHGHFDAVILDNRFAFPEDSLVSAFYTLQDGVFENNHEFYPVSGPQYRPEILFFKSERK